MNAFSPQLHIYAVHYTPFTERRARLEEQLSAAGLHDARWITEFDRETLDPTLIVPLPGNSAKLALSMTSVILKHLAAFRYAAERGEGLHLVVEDDATFVQGFRERLATCVSQLPDDWDMLFIGSGNGLHIPWWRRRLGRAVYFRGPEATWWGGGGTSRCCEAYLVAPAFARRFLEHPKSKPPYQTAIDWLMAEIGRDLRANSWWCEPELVRQGAFASWTSDRRLAGDYSVGSRLSDWKKRLLRLLIRGH